MPTPTDNVIFNAADSGGTNFVDRAFEINWLHYTAAGGHITDLSGANELNVTGDANVGVANADQRGSLLVRNATTVTANVTSMNVGVASNGNAIGLFTLEGNTTLNVGTPTVLADLNIGYYTGGGGGGAATGVFDAFDGKLTAHLMGSQTRLPAPSPLRTVRASFPAYSSSLFEGIFRHPITLQIFGVLMIYGN